MTDAQRAAIRDAVRARAVEATKNPDKARARLVSEGFYTQSGQLTPEYGGRKLASQ